MNLGDRMKMYEGLTHNTKLSPLLPTIVRLDGVSFHNFTHGLNKPYDARLCECMDDLTSFLVKESNAKIGYTQSDEISLLLYSTNIKSNIYFDGKIQKIQSVLAARASVYFNNLVKEKLPEKLDMCPVFDCRVFVVPTLEEANNYFMWRQQDCVKNSISMAAQCYYSHNELMNKNSSEKQEMLFQKGVNWSDYPFRFKNGQTIVVRKVQTPFTTEELESLPPLHNARKNPSLTMERSVATKVDMIYSPDNF